MPVYKYFGSPAIYHGKSLFHILCNLKEFGAGRIVTRSTFDSEASPCFYRILFAQPLMDEKTLEGRVIAEKIHKGVRYTEPVDLSKLASIPDFRLVPRDEEEVVCQWEQLRDYSPEKDFVVKPKHFTIPPLMKILMEREMEKRGEVATEESFLLPAFKTYPTLNLTTTGNKKVGFKEEKHQETVIKCEGTASHNYNSSIPSLLRTKGEVLEDFPDERPMPTPAVGMRMYKIQWEGKKHKEDVREMN